MAKDTKKAEIKSELDFSKKEVQEVGVTKTKKTQHLDTQEKVIFNYLKKLA